jgi:hypothetical protein
MMGIGLVYVALLALGLLYALLSGVMGWLSDWGGAGDIHVDASGHLDAGHFHPISGTTVATFITGFGGGGVIAHYLLQWNILGGLVLAAFSGLAVAAAAYAILEVIFQHTQAGSEFALAEMVGRDAEVITAIPGGGTGEVAYIARGQRESSPARSADGAAIAKGHPVVIDKVTGSTLYVRSKD